MEFISTTRGGKKLLLDGYAYILDRKKEHIKYWRCERKGACTGRIKTENDVVQGEPSIHNHPPDAGRSLALKTVQNIKERAQQSEEVTSTILQNCTCDYPLDAAGALPKKETLARMVRRQRSAPDGDKLTDDLRKTIRGEDFVIYESEDLLILSTNRSLQLLAVKDHWLCDGTFDSAPVGFQLYTVHVRMDESHTVPLVYCLARSKNQATYDLIFSTLKQVRPDLNPASVTVDFERAALNSIVSSFPNTTVYGCFFHFGQCIWREIQRLGLQTWYTDPGNALIIKSFQALAFVPPSDVVETFNELLASLNAETDELLADFLIYFEATWIGVVQRGRRRRPLFEHSLWNTLERTALNLPRTTNSLEGWHRGFEQRMAVTHPSLCRLVSKIRKEQSDWELTIEMVASGVALRKPKQKYVLLNSKLKFILGKYEEYSKTDFLRAIAHNI